MTQPTHSPLPKLTITEKQETIDPKWIDRTLIQLKDDKDEVRAELLLHYMPDESLGMLKEMVQASNTLPACVEVLEKVQNHLAWSGWGSKETDLYKEVTAALAAAKGETE